MHRAVGLSAAALAGVVVLCVVGFSGHRGTELLEYPMNADAIGDSGLVTAKAQMAFGGMEALQRQVQDMNINWGNKPQHVRQNFADAYGKLSALKKLVSHMETKDFDSAGSRLSATPDEALRSVMQTHSGDEEEEEPRQVSAEEDAAQDGGVISAEVAALHQRGRAGLHRLHSLHMQKEGLIMPPYAEKRAGAALQLSAANRRRLAQRAAVRLDNEAVVSPPWTR
jgi:hypothetical protein